MPSRIVQIKVCFGFLGIWFGFAELDTCRSGVWCFGVRLPEVLDTPSAGLHIIVFGAYGM